MKVFTRRAAAIVLAAALCLSTPVFGAPARDGVREKSGPIVRVVKKIQKILGISTHEDLPLPPIPKP